MDRRRRTDVVVALGLWAATQIEIWAFWDVAEQGPRPFAAAMATLMAAALAWRRSHPFAVVAAVAGIYAVWVAVEVPAGSLFPFVVLLVAVFTVAERCELRRAAAGGLLGLAAIWFEIAVESNEVANYAFTGVFVAGAWAAGRTVRSRQARADVFEGRAVELERTREAEARAAAAEERARIARELHDVVAHSVGVIVIQAQAAQERPGAADPETGAALRTIETTGRQALTEMRRLLGLLRSEDEELALAPQPSLRYLDRLVAQVSDAGLPVELDVQGAPVRLAPGVDLSAYRIVQEALTNALKHAGPARARVLVRYGPTELELQISDDGHGDQATGPNGHGLVGMRERVSVYGGRLESGNDPEGGYAVRVRLPLEPARP